jgi:RsiW-degrading membrane proteinase PrsW (M82 family)
MFQKLNNNIIQKLDIGIYETLIFITGLTLPIPLIFIIKFTGQSEIIEEIAKVLIVLYIILKGHSWKLRLEGVLVFGLLLGFSESIFYLINFMGAGDYHMFLLRFVTTVPMHITTVLIIFFFTELNRKFWFFGFALAILLHLLFNYFVQFPYPV